MSRSTRREFLQQSMFAAAAASAASAIPSVLHADDPQPKSAAERLGVAVVGVNGRGGDHIGAFTGRKDTEILYVVDPDEKVGNNRADQIYKKQGRRPQVVGDMRKAYEDKAVNIVSTATPNHWHALTAIWAMQAGKDVYVEKPVSHNVSEGRRIVQVARKYEQICQTGTQCRSMAGMREMMEYLHAGKIGAVKVARGLCYKRRGSIGARGKYEVPKEVDYDLWSGPAPILPLTRPKFHYDWHWQWPYGNGDLGNQGIHQMDLARWGLGVKTFAKSVLSYGGRFGYEDAGDTANTQIVVHDYGEQALVFEVRGLPTKPHRGAGVGVVFEGTEGSLVVTSYDAGAAYDKDGKEVKAFRGGGDHFANFIKAVRSRKHEDLHADIEEGHLSSALCHLGNISYRLGNLMTADDIKAKLRDTKCADNLVATFERFDEHLAENKVLLSKTPVQIGPVLAIDQETETFVDHAEADKMLTREYRAPYVVPAADKI
ncbi:MAG: gfo/Idh/MocA family oxidoreductase [Planctomycetota bacterium]|nr:MAG: gfo/Idh/MocA family oxidoreductase [Planctomycetota bacterium]